MRFSAAFRAGNCFDAFSRRKPLAASIMPALVQRRAAGTTPTLDVAADAPDCAVHVLDDVGAREGTPELVRQAQARPIRISSSPSRMLAATPGASRSWR